MISPCQYGLHAPNDCSPSIPVLNLILLEVVAVFSVLTLEHLEQLLCQMDEKQTRSSQKQA